MKKKILGIALVLLTIFAVGVVFAAGAAISKTATTVTVTNTNPTRGESIQGEVCIYLIHKNGIDKRTVPFFYGPIRPGRTETYSIPSQYAGDWTIYDASEISCFFIPE